MLVGRPSRAYLKHRPDLELGDRRPDLFHCGPSLVPDQLMAAPNAK